jgi:spoIIIJ-associated protein
MGSGEQAEGVTLQDRMPEADEVSSTSGPSEASEAATVTNGSDAAVAAASADRDAEDSASPKGSASADSDSDSEDDPAGDDSAEEEADPKASGASSPRSSRGSIRDLEEEGEVAADYLEELLDIVDVDGDIDIDVENGRASLAIVAEGGSDRSLRRLVGAGGEVLEALQELTRLAVQASTGERSRLMLDVAGHRAQRRKVLTEKASRACEQVKSSGKSLSMEAMTAFERKIVHDVVAEAGLNSESEGVDPNRHVVILPASA